MSELRHVMLNLGEELSKQELEDILKDADKDGDGQIEYDGKHGEYIPDHRGCSTIT